ncbi:MAG: UPF0280 family protein [Pseudomonadota bacterium]
MSAGPQAAWLPDGRRLHLHHGPIDLILDAWGAGRGAALEAARARFETLLEGLVRDLPALRRPVAEDPVVFDPVARRMVAAARPHAEVFVTPMAAVAGAVADEVLAALTAAGPLAKAYVNNGGDIALHLAADATPETAFRAMGPTGEIRIEASDPARGLATSGWRGRSHSLGIADAVTVAARSAAEADVAATLLANAIDLPGHPAVSRTPARALSPDSDLGDRPVTVDVGPLTVREVDAALDRGAARAEAARRRGRLLAAAMSLAGRTRATPAFPKLSGRIAARDRVEA